MGEGPLKQGDWDLTRWIAPKECFGCGKNAENPICGQCIASLEPIAGQGCSACGNPQVDRAADTCPWCRRLKRLPYEICTLYAYRNKGRELFQTAKFKGYWRLIHRLLEPRWADFFSTISFLEYDQIIPIPETLPRKIQRFFNPASVIAESLSMGTGLPVQNGLKTKFFQKRQVGLSYRQRRENNSHRFFPSKGLRSKGVILVDDVLTTGATLEAASSSLVEAGVPKIAWFSLYRTL